VGFSKMVVFSALLWIAVARAFSNSKHWKLPLLLSVTPYMRVVHYEMFNCSLNVVKANIVLVAVSGEAHSNKWYSFVENMRTVGPGKQMSCYCVKWLNLPS